MVTTTEELRAVVGRFLGPRPVAVDAEGDSLYRYHQRLCTLQLHDGEQGAVIDTLAIDDISALAPLLDPDAPAKIVHDVSFDAKMLGQRGLALGRVFDTSVAARFLSESSTGLAALLEKYLEVRIDKSHQQSDWGERPLGEDRLTYLLDDVQHLPGLADLLRARAAELDILQEIEEETRYAIATSLEPETRREPWTRIKGGRELEPSGRAILKALADAREVEAERRDVPPFRVASNRVLFEAARRRPSRVSDLRRVRGLADLEDEALEAALEKARRDGPPVEETAAPPPPEERARRKAQEKALTEWRRTEAAARGVDQQVVLPGHCLRDLVGADPTEPDVLTRVRGLGAIRVERYGAAILAILS